MCGIHAVISAQQGFELSADLRDALINRGPDYLGQVTRTTIANSSENCLSLNFTSTVLALRGDHIARQPFEDTSSESVLCWNGEAWKIDGQLVDGNDGEAIFTRLTSLATSSAEQRQSHVLRVLRSIQGPFAFLFYDAPGKCLYFGRDRLGRRSLLINKVRNADSIAFSSVADSLTPSWEEVAADGIYNMSIAIKDGENFNSNLPEGDEILTYNSPSVDTVYQHLTEALKLRVLNVPQPPASQDSQADGDIRVAILFSGGLDCTLMARLTDVVLPGSQGIDLINVAFQNARNAVQEGVSAKASDVFEACPDRVTGRKAFVELKAACPARRWRFIAVNVSFTEAMAHRSRVVSLMYPHNTEMDLSIALALYFASRGVGSCYTDCTAMDQSVPICTTPARVLLSGLGADELFGGYGRHEVAFKRDGYPGLIEELKLDVSRIATRNLGRDDRILSCWGKEVRFPFLDEDFMRAAMESPVWEKCDFANQSHPANIEPAKRVLRLLAEQMDLPSTAREKKRAIQFGARTAKIEQRTGGPKTKGTDLIQ
ncbi:asparagine synthase-domain-containing protein [Truncatella angustata]|uniref:Asparagine synthase-domain-containing protein n=1 Tax=Truncatella angustata TaxID=152316 RepID=A0A9P8UC13_9PEZI|nr:asparagine synthase-domain-containing protein [Truncatella angustata]KAH6646131.1 asparagine synthase-domain-containing protein [Truncatella angustata]